MLPRDDFVFTIGYDGPVAVIDGQAKRRYKGLSTNELIEKGLFRAAYSSAVFSENPEEIKHVVEEFNRMSAEAYPASEQSETSGTSKSPSTDRLFGVFKVEVKRSMVL